MHIFSKWQAFKIATLSGLAEPLGVIIVGAFPAVYFMYINIMVKIYFFFCEVAI